MIPVLTWHGCYDRQWRGLMVAEAFAHPAKFAPGLIDRIYTLGIAEGWWKQGDTVGDPFGGVAGGGIFAGYHGLNWVGVELEERFVTLGNANLAIHGPKWMALGRADRLVLLQGDSRRFAEVVKADAILTSPPYADNQRSDRTSEERDVRRGFRQGAGCFRTSEAYGQTDGQIGGLAAGALDGVLTSPPYADAINRPSKIDVSKCQKAGRTSQARHHVYGASEGQIGSLAAGVIDAVVTSPPWEDQESALNSGKLKDPVKFASAMSRLDGVGARNGSTARSRLAQFQRQTETTYGNAVGQLGNVTGETYWQAMRQVYGQCLLAMKPGGVMAVVVKDYVKNKARVPLCDQTLRLLVHLGFEPVLRVRAMLVKERTHAGLWEDQVERRERKSFFRRLAEKKGSPRIDWEEVIVVRKAVSAKPQAAGGAA